MFKSTVKNDSIGVSTSPLKSDSVGVSTSPVQRDSDGVSTLPVQRDSVGVSTSPVQRDSVGVSTSPVQRDSVGVSTSPVQRDSVGVSTSPVQRDSVDVSTSPVQRDSVDVSTSPVKKDSVGVSKSPFKDFIEDSITPSTEVTFPKCDEIQKTPAIDNLSINVSNPDFADAQRMSTPSIGPTDWKTNSAMEKISTNIYPLGLETNEDTLISEQNSSSADNLTDPMSKFQLYPEDDSIFLNNLSTNNHFSSPIHDSSDTSKDYISGVSTSSYASAVSQISHRSVNRQSMPTYKEAGLTDTCKSKKSVGTQIDNTAVQSNTSKSAICSKHKATVIAEEKAPVPIGTPDLCLGCSKSMLSYIMIIQKFLDGLATDICKQIDPLTQCFECVKENLNLPMQTSCKKHASQESEESRQPMSSKPRRKSGSSIKTKTQIETVDSKDDSKVSTEQATKFHQRLGETSSENSNFGQSPEFQARQVSKIEQNHQVESERSAHQKQSENKANTSEHINQSEFDIGRAWQQELNKNLYHQNSHNVQTSDIEQDKSYQQQQQSDFNYLNHQVVQQYQDNLHTHHLQEYFPTQISETQTVNDLQSEQSGDASEYLHSASSDHLLAYTTNNDSSQEYASNQFSHCVGTDGILSELYKVECGLGDTSRDLTVWERIAKIQNQCIENNQEAFVTIARNNAEVLGCLVLGVSLLLCRTTRKLCVLVSDSVHADFMAPLSSLFHNVVHTRSLDSVGTTKLSLLDQPELGITFGKLNVWRLDHFNKCVFLNPDTMVIQCCDELFNHEELSAVPDIGWPDCFNSGVFVFKPSVQTFWELLEFSDKQRSYDGGEQGLLNNYFSSWSQDITKKLSFIYNLMANVSYTYTPAFKQFGRSVKVVQFLGPFKPWHVKFDNTGQIAESSAVHPTYVQFVHIWLNLFRVCVLPQFSEDIQSFASSQQHLSAYELLRFFPSPIGSDTEFLLTPPSVRVRPYMHSVEAAPVPFTAIEKLQLPATSNPASRRSSLHEHFEQPTEEGKVQAENTDLKDESENITTSKLKSENDIVDKEDELLWDLTKVEKKMKPQSLIPGAEVGDYQGMSAWEQGRMDYEGSASSDTIIERLEYLMEKPDRLI